MSSNTSHSILVINPNTSKSMTTALGPLISNLDLPSSLRIDYFTAPEEPTTYHDGTTFKGIASINSGEESCRSAMHVFPNVEKLIGNYDGFLVACYSAHPLVGMLKSRIAEMQAKQKLKAGRKYVTGIFEASVSTSLSLISHFDIDSLSITERINQEGKAIATTSFGIITTGSVWEVELSNAVRSMLLKKASDAELRVFAGVQTTGLSAIELHTTPAEEVEERIIAATERLINQSDGTLSAICLGCAGMSGMKEIVRRGCIKALGEIKGRRIFIVDGVVAGVSLLANACRSGF